MLYDKNSRLAELGSETALYAALYYKKIDGVIYPFLSLKRTSDFLNEAIVGQNSAIVNKYNETVENKEYKNFRFVENNMFTIEGIPMRAL
jgi:hypothetical protein